MADPALALTSLVRQLRDQSLNRSLCIDAADAIQQLVEERDGLRRLLEAVEGLLGSAQAALAEAEKRGRVLEAECERISR